MHSITQFLSATHQPPRNLFKCIHFSFIELSPQWKPLPDQSPGFPCQGVKVWDLHLRAIRLQGHIWHFSPLLQIWAEGLTPFSLVEWGMKNAWFILKSQSLPVMQVIKYLTNSCAAQPRGDCQELFFSIYLFIHLCCPCDKCTECAKLFILAFQRCSELHNETKGRKGLNVMWEVAVKIKVLFCAVFKAPLFRRHSQHIRTLCAANTTKNFNHTETVRNTCQPTFSYTLYFLHRQITGLRKESTWIALAITCAWFGACQSHLDWEHLTDDALLS